MTKIKALRNGNVVVLDPTTAVVRSLIEPELSFIERKKVRMEPGEDLEAFRARLARARNNPKPNKGYELVNWKCFAYDGRDRLAFTLGFLGRVRRALRRGGIELVLKDFTKVPRPEAYVPNWEHFYWINEGQAFRHSQEEALAAMATYPYGRYSFPTGWGKGTLIRFFCQLMVEAKIAVVTRSTTILKTRLYPELSMALPSVGLVTGEKKVFGERVTLYSAGCLKYADPDTDWVLYDEGHEAAADGTAGALGEAFPRARMISLSASHDMRSDGKDLRCEGIFGPIRFHMPYQEAVEAKEIVNLKVIWRDVVMDENPAAGYKRSDKRKRHGIWRNDYRNSLIAEDARRYPDRQVIVVCETVDHVLALKKMIPEAIMLYAEASEPKGQEFFDYQEEGLIPRGHRPMTTDRRNLIFKVMSQGRAGIYLCSPVINVGANLTYMDVLVRADARRSKILDTQIPGRASRKNESGKRFGIIHDYRDQFDGGFLGAATVRHGDYALHGWEQVDSSHISRLLAQMTWGGPRKKQGA